MFSWIKERYSSGGTGQMAVLGLILGVFWIAVIAGFTIWDIKLRQQSTFDLALVEAQANFNNDLVHRKWAAGHGGVYVPITQATPPNPHLYHIPERDITTPSGRNLTLINPSYMTRQIHELAKNQYDVLGHITSINPLRPENRPDPWEEEALKTFTQAGDQTTAISSIDGREHLRFIAAMVIEKPCLKCHSHQGYKLGDIRGGISVSVPLDKYRTIDDQSKKTTLIVHGILLIIGIIAIWVAFSNLSRRDRHRYEIEQALRESEAFHRGLFEDSPAVLLLQDFSRVEKEVKVLEQRGVKNLRMFLEQNPDQIKKLAGLVRIVDANMAAVDLYKADDHATLLSLFPMISGRNKWQKLIDQIVAFTEGKDKYELQDSQYDARGNPIEVMVKKVPIDREVNGLSKVLVNIVDVTDLYRSLEEKRELERQLHQAQRIESLGNLAGGIAHDFNNILFPILGMAEILMEDLPPHTPEHENASIILDAGNRGSELVGKILAFSSGDKGKPSRLFIHNSINEVMRLMGSTIPDNVEVHRDMDKTCGPVLADPIQIQQITMNLLANAVHAVKENGGKIRIQVKEVNIDHQGKNLTDTPLPPGQYARLTVSDSGMGIPPAHISRIFEPYFTTRSKDKGTGLGLAVAYGIVKEYGGNITVRSLPGKGTDFTVYLPVDNSQ